MSDVTREKSDVTTGKSDVTTRKSDVTTEKSDVCGKKSNVIKSHKMAVLNNWKGTKKAASLRKRPFSSSPKGGYSMEMP